VRKRMLILVVLFVLLLIAVGICLKNRHAKIDEWSSRLVLEKVEMASVSKGYGVEAVSYVLSKEDYTRLLLLLQAIKEDVSSRKETSRRLEAGYRLAFFYEGKLWLFKCCENEVVSLMFEDAETGVYYGCEGDLLYIKSPELWRYIVNTVDEQAE